MLILVFVVVLESAALGHLIGSALYTSITPSIPGGILILSSGFP